MNFGLSFHLITFYHAPDLAFGAGFALKDGLRLGLGPERKSRAPDLAFGAGFALKDGLRSGLGPKFKSRVSLWITFLGMNIHKMLIMIAYKSEMRPWDFCIFWTGDLDSEGIHETPGAHTSGTPMCAKLSPSQTKWGTEQPQ